MARPMIFTGIPSHAMASGGGVFCRHTDQPMPARDGTLAVLHCCDGGGACGEGAESSEGPVPATGHGQGGVQDTALALRWKAAERDEGGCGCGS